MNGPNRLSCIACSRPIERQEELSRCVIHSCCSRPVCDACLTARPRLATFCVLCEGVQDAFRKGPRDDVTRAGQVVFDFERACDDVEQRGGGGNDVGNRDENVVRKSPPPAYSEANEQHDDGAFTIGDADDTATEDAALHSMAVEPALLRPDRLTSKRAHSDVTVNDAIQVNASASHRTDKSDDDRASASLRQALSGGEGAPRESSVSKAKRSATDAKDVDDGLTRQYWLRPNDTLMSLSLRFGINASLLCKLNDLPPSTLTSTPHLIHTRRFVLLPERAVRDVLAASSEQASQLQAALQGPAPMSRSRKVERARRQAQGRFRALVIQADSANRGRQNGGLVNSEVTPCDERAARAYVALMEEELRSIDFGDGVADDRQAIDDCKKTDERADEDEALVDAARERRFDAIVKQAVCRWEMDSDWERAQRAQGIQPDVKLIEKSRQPPLKANFSSAIPSWLRAGPSKPSEKRTAEKAR